MTSMTDGTLQVLFTGSIPVTSLTEGAASQDVVLTVVFDTEPADQTEYDLLQTGGTLTITATFTVTPD